MPTVSFTHRIDAELREELEEMALLENRSASFMANQAIANLVAERKATRALIETGLELVRRGQGAIAADDVHSWLLSADVAEPFPEGKTGS